jgi:hypothetical protein
MGAVAVGVGCAAGDQGNGFASDGGNDVEGDGAEADAPESPESPETSTDGPASAKDGGVADSTIDVNGEDVEMVDASLGVDATDAQAAADASEAGDGGGSSDAHVEAGPLADAHEDGHIDAEASTEAGSAADAETDGATGCTSPTQCPTPTSACLQATCSMGACGTSPASAGTACTDNGGVACDGQGSCTQPFTVVRVGSGTGALASTATPVFLDTFYPVANATAVSSIAMPTVASGGNQPLLLSGTATSEGGFSRSIDGHYLVMAGYAAATGAATTGTTRLVGRVDSAGAVDTTTTLAAAAFSGSNVRSVASSDGTAFWIGGTSSSTGGGVWYETFGTSGGTQIAGTPDNVRVVDIFAGQLYGNSGSSGFTSVFTVGTGLPTTAGSTATALSGMTTSSPYGYVMFSLGGGGAIDTLFVADDGAGVERWTLSGATWARDATFTVEAAGCRGLTGWQTSSGVTLLAVRTTSEVDRIDVPSTGAPTLTSLVTAATDTAYRGVALAAR